MSGLRTFAMVTLAASPALFGLAAGCDREGEPRPQWVVHVGTDAALPAFGNQLRIEVIDEDGQACAECVRVFAVDDATIPVSFGVTAEGGRRFVRARLYHAESVSAFGEPTTPLLDVLAELPEAGDGVLDVQLLLSLGCFGHPVNTLTKLTCDPATGEDTTSLVLEAGDGESLPRPGTWRFEDVACPDEVPEGMVCVPGGTFLLGSRSYRPFGPDFDPVPEQLVHVPTYLVDEEEMTVATFRTVVGADGVGDPIANSDTNPYCRFTPDGGELEDASINCISRETAEAACVALGKRLPTEAEWEYAAGGASLDAPFPWAIPDPVSKNLCVQAVVARDELLGTGSRECSLLEPDLPLGPQIGGATLDVSFLGIHNLAGNLSEWVADDFVPFADEACWGDDLELRDGPTCSADGADGTIRGGDWRSFVYNTHAFFRRPAPKGIRIDSIGVRCARSVP